ncbi:MAG: hypothetical protein U5N26_11935 [Candidatus Marinimicrobia bacterium]|nr:hypothetical protein [Candidatus Neomarinimicrobiota bacterium]
MKTKNILTTTFILLLTGISALTAGMQYHEIMFIPWGDGKNALGHKAYPGLHNGPAAFQAADGRIIFLDSENGKLKTFDRDGVMSSREISLPHITDFHYKNNTLYLLGARKLYRCEEKDIEVIAEENAPRKMFQGFYEQDRELFVKHRDGTRILSAGRFRKPGLPPVRVERQLPDKVMITAGGRSLELTVRDVGSVDYIGSTPDGLMYIYAESVVRHVPVKVDRFVYVMDKEGAVQARIRLPRNQYAYIFREFDVAPDGALYHMQSTERGVHVVRWEYDLEYAVTEAEYPEIFTGIPHFNGLAESEPAAAEPPFNKTAAASAAGVTRSEALEIADTHVRHVWTATAEISARPPRSRRPPGCRWARIRAFPINGAAGTPSPSLTRGSPRGSWRAISTLPRLTGEIRSATIVPGMSAFAGKPARKYGTSTIGNVSTPLSSVNDLLPGDATNKAGNHIRLFVEWTGDGKLVQAEATSSGDPGWYTRYYTWTVSGISGYVPVRYHLIEGGQVPRPTLLYAVSKADSVTLGWTADESSEFTGYKIYRKTCDEDLFMPVKYIPTGTHSTTLSHEAGLHYDYRVNTYIDDGETPEMGSDVYAVKHLNGEKQILIVDGFDRFSGSGSYAYPTHDFAAKTAKTMALQECGLRKLCQ